MKVRKIRVKNIGPIGKLEVNFPTDKEKPSPIVLVGLNGSGKSIVLSYIADAFIEFKRHFYEDIEAEPQKYFRVCSSSYVKSGAAYGFCEILFEESGKEYFYSEVLNLLKWEEFKEKFEKEKLSINGVNLNDSTFKEKGIQKFVTSKCGNLKKVVDNNVFLYFPWNRTEVPYWINKGGIKIPFRRMEKFIGCSYRNIVNLGNFEELYSWILGVILDMYVYQEMPYDLSLRNNLNFIIDEILSDKKNHQNERIRFGIGRREVGTRISIIKDQLNEKGQVTQSELISPTIFHLSSGESALLNIFASILMDYDKQPRQKKEFSLEEITGIVLIDEADLHLHMKLQAETFPRLLKLFPNIQFIITTHSPFLVYGLQEAFQDELQVIELPNGNLISADSFIEFRNALEKFNEIGENYRRQKIALEEKIKIITKPLIITEGKTDWMILKKAKEKLNIGLDIELYEPQEDLGKDNLMSMCKAFSKVHQPRPLIFIFDRDLKESEVRKVMDDSKGYKDWGNNVFSFILPVPSHREKYKNITIEMFFTDEEIKTKDSNGKRLFFTNEVKKIVDLTTNKLERYKIAPPKTSEEYDKKILADKITYEVENGKGNKEALSKTKFAEYIYNDIPPFNLFNFGEFKKIFKVTEKILSESNHT